MIPMIVTTVIMVSGPRFTSFSDKSDFFVQVGEHPVVCGLEQERFMVQQVVIFKMFI